MASDSYWNDSAPAFGSGRTGDMVRKVDVAVIGGGFTGLSAAIALAKRGATVAVLEAKFIGAEASGRNGGHCNNGLSMTFAKLVDQLGREHAEKIYRTYNAAVDTVESLVEEYRIDCDFRRSGKIKLAAKPEHFSALAKSFEVLRASVDPDTDLIPPEAIRAEIGSDKFHGGLLHRRSASMHMGSFAQGLAQAAVGRGAEIYEGAAVTKLKRLSGGRHEITTARGVIEAGQVLVATGTSSHGPFGYFRRRIIPVGSFVIATEQLTPALVDEIMPHRRTMTTTKTIGNHFRITPDNRLIFGGRARFSTANAKEDRRSSDILAQNMRDVFPQLAKIDVAYAWSGLVDMTTDRLPRAGEHDGLFYSMGYSGHGVQMSVHMGQVMSDVMNGNIQANPLAALKWKAIPGYIGTPWFLPIVGAYHRMKDARN